MVFIATEVAPAGCPSHEGRELKYADVSPLMQGE